MRIQNETWDEYKELITAIIKQAVDDLDIGIKYDCKPIHNLDQYKAKEDACNFFSNGRLGVYLRILGTDACGDTIKRYVKGKVDYFSANKERFRKQAERNYWKADAERRKKKDFKRVYVGRLDDCESGKIEQRVETT
jgi:hypothetical protein